MSKWRYKVKAAVHPVVHYMSSVQPTLIMKVSLKLIVNVLDDGLEADIRKRNRHRLPTEDITVIKFSSPVSWQDGYIPFS